VLLKRVSEEWLAHTKTSEKSFSRGYFDPAYVATVWRPKYLAFPDRPRTPRILRDIASLTTYAKV